MSSFGDALWSGLRRVDPVRARAMNLRLLWPEIAGPALAARARPRMEGARVVLEVSDERWAVALAGMASELREKLNRALGGVREVTILRVATPITTAKARPMATKFAPPPPVRLREGSAIERIADTELRDLARRVAESCLGRERERH